MSATEVHNASGDAAVGKVDMHLEVVRPRVSRVQRPGQRGHTNGSSVSGGCPYYQRSKPRVLVVKQKQARHCCRLRRRSPWNTSSS